MAIKFDRLFERFDEKGITTYTLRQKKIVGNETLRKLKNNTGVIDTRTIDKLWTIVNKVDTILENKFISPSIPLPSH